VITGWVELKFVNKPVKVKSLFKEKRFFLFFLSALFGEFIF